MKQFIGSVCDSEGLRGDTFFRLKHANIKNYRNSFIHLPKSLQKLKTSRSLVTTSHIRNHKIVTSIL